MFRNQAQPAGGPTLSGDNEAQLTAAAMAGDHDALTALLRQCSPQLHARLAAKIDGPLRAALDVDDVLQVTYLEAFQRIGQFEARGDGAFLAWITRIGENNLLDAVRALGRAKRPPARMQLHANDDSTVALYDRLMMTTTTPSRHVAKAEIAKTLEQALQCLPDDYARVIRLYELQGKSAADVAAEIQRSEGAVFMLRARALDRLREVLAEGEGRIGRV